MENIMERKQHYFEEIEEDCSRRTYNVMLTVTVLYGLLINVVLCQEIRNPTQYVGTEIFFMLYTASTVIGTVISLKSDKPLISFIGYNLIVLPTGICTSAVVNAFGGLESTLVRDVFLLTFIITLTMSAFAFVKPGLVSKFGSTLIFLLIGVLLAGIVCLIFKIHTNVLSWAAAVIYSGYIAYDVWKSQQYSCTLDNAVDSAIDIYLDIIGLFINLLRIFASSKERD